MKHMHMYAHNKGKALLVAKEPFIYSRDLPST